MGTYFILGIFAVLLIVFLVKRKKKHDSVVVPPIVTPTFEPVVNNVRVRITSELGSVPIVSVKVLEGELTKDISIRRLFVNAYSGPECRGEEPIGSSQFVGDHVILASSTESVLMPTLSSSVGEWSDATTFAIYNLDLSIDNQEFLNVGQDFITIDNLVIKIEYNVC